MFKLPDGLQIYNFLRIYSRELCKTLWDELGCHTGWTIEKKTRVFYMGSRWWLRSSWCRYGYNDHEHSGPGKTCHQVIRKFDSTILVIHLCMRNIQDHQARYFPHLPTLVIPKRMKSPVDEHSQSYEICPTDILTYWDWTDKCNGMKYILLTYMHWTFYK